MRSLLLRLTLVLVLLFVIIEMPTRICSITAHAQTCESRLIDAGEVGDSLILVFLQVCSDGSMRLIAIRITELAGGDLEVIVTVQAL
jgi:hypothetical protein